MYSSDDKLLPCTELLEYIVNMQLDSAYNKY